MQRESDQRVAAWNSPRSSNPMDSLSSIRIGVRCWQAHSVRGFLSRTLGKKTGTPVESFKSEAGERAYRLK